MELIKLARVSSKRKVFKLNGQLFTIEHRQRNDMKIWKIYKPFRRVVEYRVLSDVARKVPVGVQRLEEAS